MRSTVYVWEIVETTVGLYKVVHLRKCSYFHDYQVREIVSLQQDSYPVAFQFCTPDEHSILRVSETRRVWGKHTHFLQELQTASINHWVGSFRGT